MADRQARTEPLCLRVTKHAHQPSSSILPPTSPPRPLALLQCGHPHSHPHSSLRPTPQLCDSRAPRLLAPPFAPPLAPTPQLRDSTTLQCPTATGTPLCTTSGSGTDSTAPRLCDSRAPRLLAPPFARHLCSGTGTGRFSQGCIIRGLHNTARAVLCINTYLYCIVY